MKVILNEDVKHLGEMGDVKVVANGYYRNYLLPRGFVVPFNPDTVAYFETKKAEIEARKEQKRKDSASLKTKLEALAVELTMPAGANGKLYGAVTNLTLAEYFAKNGFEVERKRIDIPGLTIKSTGTYHVTIRLYEAQTATVSVTVKGQVSKEDQAKADAAATKAAEKEKAEEKVTTEEVK